MQLPLVSENKRLYVLTAVGLLKNCISFLKGYTLKNAGLFQPKCGSNMDNLTFTFNCKFFNDIFHCPYLPQILFETTQRFQSVKQMCRHLLTLFSNAYAIIFPK